MTWNEPHAIAHLLAARLGSPLQAGDAGSDAAAAVLLLSAAQLADTPEAALARAPGVIVSGPPEAATSHGLDELRAAVTARGAEVVLATFATAPTDDGAHADVPLVVAGPPGERRLAELVAAGPRALTLDDAVDAGPAADEAPPARVCIVSFEVAGLTGGGIGTASTALAETLARRGHDVTLLFTGWQDDAAAQRTERWRAHYAERGVRLEVVRSAGASAVRSPHFRACSAYEVYCWLRQADPFDVVHVPENIGQGLYAQLAKRQGERFASTTFVVGTHGPTRWAAEANRTPLTHEEFLVSDAMERTSLALADVLLGPSRYLHDYLRERGWELPARVHVQPYATPPAVRDATAPTEPGTDLPRELVLFGRLETRKGVALFCDALDLLAQDDDLPPLATTFLGPVAEVHGTPADVYIAARAQRWPWPWRILSDKDQQGAAEYLRRPGVLAVMPSLVDNAPNTVSEAVALGIPFVAGRDGGTGELVRAEQRDEHMVGSAGADRLPGPLHVPAPSTDPRPLAELLRRRLTTAVSRAEAPFDADAVEVAYDRWHRAVRRAREQEAASTNATETPPSLAVCVLFAGDRELLAAQLDVLRDGEAEVVVADLSEAPEEGVADAVARDAGIDADVVRPTRPGHAGEARAAAVAATSADVIALLPPTDVPLPGFVAGLRRAAAATDADVYGCVVLDELDERDAADLTHAFVPLAGPPLAGLTHPAFAVGAYAIRRAALARLGGFATNARADEADHELLNRAAAARLRIEVVPDPLAAKRRPDRWSAFRASGSALDLSAYDADQQLRVLRALAPDEDAADRLSLLVGAREDDARVRRDLREQQLVQEQQAAELRSWIGDLEATSEQLRDERAQLLATVEQLRDDQHTLVLDIDRLVGERDALQERVLQLEAPLRLLRRCKQAVRRRLARLRP